MASTEWGTQVDTQLTALLINTRPEVETFRKLPRISGNMATVIAALSVSRNGVFVSRRRVRHDARLLLNEGAL